MRISDQRGFLELASADDPEFPYLRIAAGITTRSGEFRGHNDQVLFGGGDPGRAALHAFRDFDSDRVRVELTEDCWIDVERAVRGNLTVRFAIAVTGGDAPTAMSGQLAVAGEDAQAFVAALCHELKR